MSDATLEKGSPTVAAKAAADGKIGPKVADLASFQSPPSTGGTSADRGSSPSGKSGKGKSKIGRPPKNSAGFSKAKIDEVEDDPDVEAAREEFETVLVELLVAATDGMADSRYQTLLKKYPQSEAKGLADKARLTDKERKYFGGVAVRIWRKYLGDKYLFTDEGIAAVYGINYAMRNFEGFNAARKITAEENAKSANKQPGVPSPAGSRPGGERDGKDGASLSNGSHAPGDAGARV